MQPNPDKQKKIEFGYELRPVRKAVGMRQSDVADYVGLASVSITNLESGDPIVSMETVKRIAVLFGCNLQDPVEVMKLKAQKLKKLRQQGVVKPEAELLELPPQERRSEQIKTAKLLCCDTIADLLITKPLDTPHGQRKNVKKSTLAPVSATAKASVDTTSKKSAESPEKPMFDPLEQLSRASRISGKWRYNPNARYASALNSEMDSWGRKVTKADSPKKGKC